MGVRTPPIRFSIFEVDLASGELRKNGERIRLQEQPFQTLVALLERPGEVLTREDLQERLWPADVVVDFDRGLNKAINRLREDLDSLDRWKPLRPASPRQVPVCRVAAGWPSAAGWPASRVLSPGSAF